MSAGEIPAKSWAQLETAVRAWAAECDGLPPEATVRDPAHDPVHRPSHYTHSAIEVLDAIEAWGLGFHLGNVVKYVARSGHKGSELEDLRKARFYLNRAISKLEAP